MLKKQDKIFEVENLKAKIKDAKSVSLADLKGLTMVQTNQLRDKVKAAGGELQVVKNSLFLRALRGSGYKPEKDSFEGPNMALFANTDEVSSLKAFVNYAKTLGGLLALKIGYMDGKIYTAEEMNRFASLPTKIDLQTKLVCLLASPSTRLVRSLNWNIQKLVLVIERISKLDSSEFKKQKSQ